MLIYTLMMTPRHSTILIWFSLTIYKLSYKLLTNLTAVPSFTVNMSSCNMFGFHQIGRLPMSTKPWVRPPPPSEQLQPETTAQVTFKIYQDPELFSIKKIFNLGSNNHILPLCTSYKIGLHNPRNLYFLVSLWYKELKGVTPHIQHKP